LRGVEVRQTKEQALELASEAAVGENPAALRIYSWYVPLGDQRIAPKWLAGHLTGLPVSAFTTGEARRVLTQMGLEVRRASSLREHD